MFQRPISQLVQELDSILVKQKVVSCVSEKAKWWEGRRALDSRVEVSEEWWGVVENFPVTLHFYTPLLRHTEE